MRNPVAYATVGGGGDVTIAADMAGTYLIKALTHASGSSGFTLPITF
jgi:hypothetical protein